MSPQLTRSQDGKTYLDDVEVTTSAAELNILDGVTADKDELNILDGVTADKDEINTLAGVTPGTLAASKAVVVDASSQIDALDVKTTLKKGGVEVTSTADELNKLASVTPGTVAASKAVVVGAGKAVDLLTVCKKKEVDASGGDVAEHTIFTIPAGSFLLDIIAYCTEAFNGDTNKKFQVGVAGNTDKYVDDVDCPVTLDGQLDMLAGTNNDQKYPEFLVAETAIRAIATNNANATAGKMMVYVVYAVAAD